MKYMGSKSRHAKELLPLILANHEKGMCYLEPFVGGANMIDKVSPSLRRIGCDINPYLIALLSAASDGWLPPSEFTEDQYNYIRNNKDDDKVITGYAGFALSYGGKWFGGWRRDKDGKRDYVAEAYRSAIKQFPNIQGVEFRETSVFDINTSEYGKCTIYCDPPYKDTTKYNTDFDHNRFYEWCRTQTQAGNSVFISEYQMPPDFICVWEKPVKSSLTENTGGKMAVEKLFTLGRK